MVPSSSSNCSTDTSSGSSTSPRARYSSRSRIEWPPLACDGVDALRLQQLADLGRRLSALGQPVSDPLLVEADRRRLGLRVVLTDRLDEAPVTGRALVGDDDPPHRVL